MTKSNLLLRWALVTLALIAMSAVIIIGRDFIYPICLAILFSYLIYPLASFLENYFNRSLSTLISVLLAVAVILGVVIFLYEQISFFLQDTTSLRKQANENLMSLQLYLAENTPITFSSENGLSESLLNMISAGDNSMNKILNATTGTLVGLGLQPVYIYFMLYYRDHFKEFLFKVTSEANHQNLTKILKEISSVTKNYVSGVFLVVIILCFLNSFGLMIVGIKYAVMFGILSAIMNFIPYFGTLIGGAIPLTYALVSDEPRNALGVLILFLIIQFTENNILTPNITGGRVAINPLFTIFIIILGGMAWGIPGMFIAVPFLGMFKVVCQNVDSLKPIAFAVSPKRSKGNSWWQKAKHSLRHLLKK